MRASWWKGRACVESFPGIFLKCGVIISLLAAMVRAQSREPRAESQDKRKIYVFPTRQKSNKRGSIVVHHTRPDRGVRCGEVASFSRWNSVLFTSMRLAKQHRDSNPPVESEKRSRGNNIHPGNPPSSQWPLVGLAHNSKHAIEICL